MPGGGRKTSSRRRAHLLQQNHVDDSKDCIAVL